MKTLDPLICAVAMIVGATAVFPGLSQPLSWNEIRNAGFAADEQSNYVDAEKSFTEALRLAQSSQPKNCYQIFCSLNNLGYISHPLIALALTTLGSFYTEQNKNAQAEQYYRRGLAIQDGACLKILNWMPHAP